MEGAAGGVEGRAGTAGIEAQERAAAEGEAGDRIGGREMGGAGKADDVVRGEGDDLIMAAEATGVALVGEGAAGGHHRDVVLSQAVLNLAGSVNALFWMR